VHRLLAGVRHSPFATALPGKTTFLPRQDVIAHAWSLLFTLYICGHMGFNAVIVAGVFHNYRFAYC
jgi:hypothetical protein